MLFYWIKICENLKFLLVSSLKGFFVLEFLKQMENKGIWNFWQNKNKNQTCYLVSNPAIRKGFQHSLSPRFRVLFQTVYWRFLLLSMATKNRYKWWSRGELPRKNETAAKVQGKTHHNWSNSQLLSVHSSKSLAQMLAASFQHCLWWLCSTCLQGSQRCPAHAWRHTHTHRGGSARAARAAAQMRSWLGFPSKVTACKPQRVLPGALKGH